MIERTVSPADLARLKAQREAADRAYNAALTALDAATGREPDLPHPPPGPDEHQVTPLNSSWLVEGASAPVPLPAGWKGRVAARLWALVSPFVGGAVRDALARQQVFNSQLVDHINRNIAPQRAVRESIASTIALINDQTRALLAFQSHLIVFLQQLTPYVDTKDYEFSGLGARLHEDNRELIDWIDHRTVGLGGAISGVGDELAKRWESMTVRERRLEAHVTRLDASFEELRSSLAVVTQTHLAVKRELERSSPSPTASGAASANQGASATGVVAHEGADASLAGFQQAAASSIDSYKYVGFEERFRGSQADIRARLESYLPVFAGASDVLDIGCGRGEFIELLQANGVTARGLDLNHEMVEICRAKGLAVDEGDALSYLRSLPDASLGGIFAAQVVEHLQPDYLIGVLDVAYHKLRPGSRLVLETINPACWYAFFSSYIRDLTHVRPVHPDTLSYFMQASGFQRVRVEYRAPYPERDKLQPLQGADVLTETFNHNVAVLNALMFTHLDYAALGERM